MAVYFGSTADMLRVATSDTRVSQQVASSTSETMQYQVTEDGDYILNISGLPATYDLKIMVFDDGNSDFGIEETPTAISTTRLSLITNQLTSAPTAPTSAKTPTTPALTLIAMKIGPFISKVLSLTVRVLPCSTPVSPAA